MASAAYRPMLGVPEMTTSTSAPGRPRGEARPRGSRRRRCRERWRARPGPCLREPVATSRGVGNAHDIRQHPAVFDARHRLHAVVGEHRVLVAIGGVTGAACRADAAAHLERGQHELTGPHPFDAVTDLDDLGDRFVAEREAVVARAWADHDEERIDLATRDRQRTNQRIAGRLDLRRRHFPPLDRARARRR